jgi:hypothetical protein
MYTINKSIKIWFSLAYYYYTICDHLRYVSFVLVCNFKVFLYILSCFILIRCWIVLFHLQLKTLSLAIKFFIKIWNCQSQIINIASVLHDLIYYPLFAETEEWPHILSCFILIRCCYWKKLFLSRYSWNIAEVALKNHQSIKPLF